jgi:glycosyltransferase involved in cell wall biosynthesis
MERFKVAIVIPAFNEEKTIKKVVNSVSAYGLVIVVDDCSTDETADIAKKNGALVVEHDSNKGYDKALDSGFSKVNELELDAIITFDADGQHDTNAIPKFIEEMERGYDMVLGVRPKTQRASETIFKIILKAFYGWKDPLCGMKGYRMHLYKKLGHFDSFSSIGTELAFFGIRQKYHWTQIDIDIADRQDNPRFFSIIMSNIVILKALFRLLSNKRSKH